MSKVLFEDPSFGYVIGPLNGNAISSISKKMRKSFAELSRQTRLEEKGLKQDAAEARDAQDLKRMYDAQRNHAARHRDRTHVLRKMLRHMHLAHGFLHGRSREEVEKFPRERANAYEVNTFVHMFATDLSMVKHVDPVEVDAWLDGGFSYIVHPVEETAK